MGARAPFAARIAAQTAVMIAPPAIRLSVVRGLPRSSIQAAIGTAIRPTGGVIHADAAAHAPARKARARGGPGGPPQAGGLPHANTTARNANAPLSHRWFTAIRY